MGRFVGPNFHKRVIHWVHRSETWSLAKTLSPPRISPALPPPPATMAASKASTNNVDDIDTLKADIASFASSLGLASSTPSSGFNDVDFRKHGPLKPIKHQKNPKRTPQKEPANKTQNPKFLNSKAKEQPKPKPKPPVLALEDGNDKPRSFDKFKNLPKLPLVKASVLGAWYVDAAELEAKVLGNGEKMEVKNVEEWKKVVEKKRELGERLMAQYAVDYEASRGKSGDIRMLVTTQRSGTAADKVSAFSVMVGDNPVANLRSLDALLGKFEVLAFKFLRIINSICVLVSVLVLSNICLFVSLNCNFTVLVNKFTYKMYARLQKLSSRTQNSHPKRP